MFNSRLSRNLLSADKNSHIFSILNFSIIALLYLGSGITLYGKVKFFHLGIMGIIFMFLNKNINININISKSFIPNVFICIWVMIQFFLVKDTDRYFMYSAFLFMGMIVFNYSFLNVKFFYSIPEYFFYLIYAFWVSCYLIDLYFYINSFTGWKLILLAKGSYLNGNDLSVSMISLMLLLYLLKKNYIYLFLINWIFCLLTDRRASYLSLIIFLGLILLDKTIKLKKRAILLLLCVAIFSAIHVDTGSLKIKKLLSRMDVISLIKASNSTYTYQKESINVENSSEEVRGELIRQMIFNLKRMNIYEMIFGQGLGQLNLKLGQINYYSPHFYWLEMFFYIGAIWPIYLITIFFNLKSKEKVIFIVFILSSISMSSLVYFMPFYFFMGVLTAFAYQNFQNRQIRLS